MLCLGNDALEPDQLERVMFVLDELTRVCKGRWRWNLIDEPTFRQGKAIDVVKRLYVSFDLSGDAMLSRMTLQDLKGARYAYSGGLPTGA